MDPVPALHDTSIGVLCIDTSPLCDAPTLVESVASTSWIQTEQRSIPVAVQNRSWSVALPSALMAPAAYHDHGGDKSADDGLWHACGVCHTKETPQWRTGPDGPGTLCNACGIRYRMGGDKLVPEYRPSTSPFFKNGEHSNRHSKVEKLREKKVKALKVGFSSVGVLTPARPAGSVDSTIP
jgi:hypothetical protein